MLFTLLISLGIYLLPLIVGFATGRLDGAVINDIRNFDIKGNNKAMAVVVNIVGIFTGFIPLLSLIAWCATWYFVFKKVDYEDDVGDCQLYTSNEKSQDSIQVSANEKNNIVHKDTSVSIEAEKVAREVVAKSLSNISANHFTMDEGGGYEYKSIPAPSALLIQKNSDYGKTIRNYASIINAEAVDGWDFFLIQEIPITQKAGCIPTLLGKSDTGFFINMLVFRRVK